VEVTSGGQHSCGIEEIGNIFCWGDDSFGQSSPPAVQFSHIAAGLNFTCGIRKTDDQVECWGDDSAGQLSPPAGFMFTALYMSPVSEHACALEAPLEGGPTSYLRCWGDNSLSQTEVPLTAP
jgi:hypothetical protein